MRMINIMQRGFSLIELIVAVVIVGILAGLAFPAYTRYVNESRRSDAYNALSTLANDLEKFRSECGAYTSDITTAGRSCTAPAPSGTLGWGANGNNSPEGYYRLNVALVAGGGYTLTATAQGLQLRDDRCRTFVLNNVGVRSATDSGGANTTTSCWKR